MGKGKRQRLLRQNPRAPRHISSKPAQVSLKAAQLNDALDRLDKVKVSAFGELIWPESEKAEPEQCSYKIVKTQIDDIHVCVLHKRVPDDYEAFMDGEIHTPCLMAAQSERYMHKDGQNDQS